MRKIWIGIGIAIVVILITTMGVNAEIPENWIKVSEDGFFGDTPQDRPSLFETESNLYAEQDMEIYKFQDSPCIQWKKLTNAIPDVSSEPFIYIKNINNIVYLTGEKDHIWFKKDGEELLVSNWKKVTSAGLPSDFRLIIPQTFFNGKLYVKLYRTVTTGKYSAAFDIYRTSDYDKTSMTWEKVVSDGFGDPQNQYLGYLGIYNNKLIAVTDTTRTTIFGAYEGFGEGIEVWESPSGDSGSWKQVNIDGFGTELTINGKTFRTNQDFGAASAYKGHFYAGTLAHFDPGAQLWRYDGTGLSIWKDVTPPGLSAPSRIFSLAVFQDLLYLAEGYPTGRIQKFDGTTWTTVVEGPYPFEDVNEYGFDYLTVYKDKIFAITQGGVVDGKSYGPQIWSYPYINVPPTCKILSKAIIGLTPETATNELSNSQAQTHTVTAIITSDNNPVSGVDIDINIISGPNAGISVHSITNNDGKVEFTYTAIKGLAGLGTDDIKACFNDPDGNKVCDQAEKKWIDSTPPVPKCLESTNPADKIPKAKNEDGFYELSATDSLDPQPKIYVVDTGSGKEFGPYVSGTKIKYTQAPNGIPGEKPIGGPNSAVKIHIIGNGDASIKAVDYSGNVGTTSCLVPPPPK